VRISEPLPALRPSASWNASAAARASSAERDRRSAAATVAPMSLGRDLAHIA